MKLAKIIPIRPDVVVTPPTCFECVHGYLGQSGVICEITMSHVFDERTATACEAFEKESTDGTSSAS